MASHHRCQESYAAPSVARRPLCELCHSPAVFLCPSDEASLCRRCDSMVHGANFLVARHRRQFLCCICSRPTSSFMTGARIPVRRYCICSRCSIIHQYSCASASSFCPGDVDGYGGVSPPSSDSESQSGSTGNSVLTDCDLDSDAPSSSETISATVERSHNCRRSSGNKDDGDGDGDGDDAVIDDGDGDDEEDVNCSYGGSEQQVFRGIRGQQT